MTPLTRSSALCCACLAFGLLAAIQTAEAVVRPTETSAPANPIIRLEPVANGFANPLELTHAGDGSKRLFVVEQGGRIKIVSNGQTLATPFLDIAARITSGGERGLLGLAFHPRYRDNGLFYVNYTNTNGDTVIERFRVSAGDANRADVASGQILLTVAQPFANHNGGKLTFGPDGYLYIGLGDGGSGNDPNNVARDRSQLLGKMLRIDVDRTTPPAAGCPNGKAYGVPAGNPFAGDPCASNPRPEIWAIGLRNPWRYSFDRATGDLYIGDVGQGAWEEVSFQPAGAAGLDYGWKECEGSQTRGGGSVCSLAHTAPIAEYDHGSTGGQSITGGYVYRGFREPSLQGIYFFGDYVSGKLWGMRAGSNPSSVLLLLTGVSTLSSFGEDEDGELYVLRFDGTVSRIAATGASNVLTSYDGLWWNASLSGRGLHVAQNGDKLFFAYYTYDAAGQPTWWVASSTTRTADGRIANGPAFTPSAAPFHAYDATRFASGTSIGDFRGDFRTAIDLDVALRASGTVTPFAPMTRFVFADGSRPTGAPTNTSRAGMWWGGTSQNGWGVSIAEQFGQLFAVWYTYDDTGKATWFVIPGGTWNSNQFSGRAYRATVSSSTAQGVATDVGSVTLTFTSPATATFDYSVQGRTGRYTLNRFAF